jgi:hypothetical protein
MGAVYCAVLPAAMKRKRQMIISGVYCAAFVASRGAIRANLAQFDIGGRFSLQSQSIMR